MDSVMAARKQTTNFEDRVFDMLIDRFDRQDERLDKQDDKLAKILTQTQKTNGRVTALEKSKERNLNIPTSVLYLFAAGAVIVLLIVAKLIGVEVPKL